MGRIFEIQTNKQKIKPITCPDLPTHSIPDWNESGMGHFSKNMYNPYIA
jgi:hypothetical protein